MQISNVPGCCAMSNLYDVGTAHSKPISIDQFEFNLKVENLLNNSCSHIQVITNSVQTRERKFLKELGFNENPVVEGSSLFVHFAVRERVREKINEWKSKEGEYRRILKEKQDAAINAILSSPFRKPRPPYTQQHLIELLRVLDLHAQLPIYQTRFARYQTSKVPSRNSISCYYWVTQVKQHLPKGTIERYFSVSLSDSEYDSLFVNQYLYTNYYVDDRSVGFDSDTCFINIINNKLGYPTPV